MKEIEIKSLLSLLPTFMNQISDQQRDDLQEKVEALQQQWIKLTSQLEERIQLSRTYVKFHSLAVDLATELDSLEEKMRETGEQTSPLQEKWFSSQQIFRQLDQVGRNFIIDCRAVSF